MIEDDNHTFKRMIEKNESSAIDETEFNRSHDPILSRFSIIFAKKVNFNPMYHAVFCMLQQGVDEYHIIEELLQKNEELSKDLIKISENKPPKYIRDE